MTVNIPNNPPLWLHMLATLLAAAAWAAVAVLNVKIPELQAAPLDAEFPKRTTDLLLGALLMRFGVGGAR